jgi:hypothetical protein
MNDPRHRQRPARRGLVDRLRAAAATGARAALATFVLASAWTAVSLGRVLRPRAAGVS